MAWIGRHIVLTMLLLLAGITVLLAFWQLFLILGLLAAAGCCMYRLGVLFEQHSREQIRLRQWREYEQKCLAWRAEVEDYLWRIGDPRGFWGIRK